MIQSISKNLFVHSMESFDYYLAFHCAPTIAGVKVANLITIKKQKYTYDEIFHSLDSLRITKNIDYRILHEKESSYLFLVYNKSKLTEELNEIKIHRFLLKYGYDMASISLENALERLALRIENCACKQSYPHEIGVFLGYPLSDIIGFMYYKGCRYKLSGYWKVYSNAERAQKLFALYDTFKEYYCTKVASGKKIYQIDSRGVVA